LPDYSIDGVAKTFLSSNVAGSWLQIDFGQRIDGIYGINYKGSNSYSYWTRKAIIQVSFYIAGNIQMNWKYWLNIQIFIDKIIINKISMSQMTVILNLKDTIVGSFWLGWKASTITGLKGYIPFQSTWPGP
jgi:hypothetical protein